MTNSLVEKPEHLKFFEEHPKGKEQEDTRTDPLDGHARIEQLWTTPFMEVDITLPDAIRYDLINVLHKKEQSLQEIRDENPQFYSIVDSKGFYATTLYNLFANPQEYPEKDTILEFEKISTKLIRYYIRKGWGIQQADELELEGRCFGNIQQPGARTYPHYHQDVNGVLVHYLSMGEGNLTDNVMKDSEKSPRHPTHNVLFQDPRPAISYPYWQKIHAVTPRVGLTLIHPNYLWHETNPWLGQGERSCIVVNFRIVSHGYNELIKPFRF